MLRADRMGTSDRWLIGGTLYTLGIAYTTGSCILNLTPNRYSDEKPKFADTVATGSLLKSPEMVPRKGVVRNNQIIARQAIFYSRLSRPWRATPLYSLPNQT